MSFCISCLSLCTSTKCFVTERHLLDSLRRGLWFSASVQRPARPRCWRMMWQFPFCPEISLTFLSSTWEMDHPGITHSPSITTHSVFLSSCSLWSSLCLLLCLFLFFLSLLCLPQTLQSFWLMWWDFSPTKTATHSLVVTLTWLSSCVIPQWLPLSCQSGAYWRGNCVDVTFTCCR